MKIALYAGKRDNAPKVGETTWERLSIELTTHHFTNCLPCPGSDCPSKDGKAWSPIALSAAERRSENVTEINALVLDFDYVSAKSLLTGISQIEGSYAYAAHSTHSNGHEDPKRSSCSDPGPYSVRLVLPLLSGFKRGSRTHDDFRSLWRDLRSTIIERLQLPAARDDGKDLARLYFLPSAPDGSEVLAYRGEGPLFDIAPYLDEVEKAASVEKRQTIGPSNVVQLSPIEGQDAIDLKQARKALKSVKRSRPLIARILEGRCLAQPGERDTTVNEVSSTCAWALPRLPVEAFLELIRPSLVAMPHSEGLDEWLEKAKSSFLRARQRYAERRESEILEAKLIRESLEAAAGVGRKEGSGEAGKSAGEDGSGSATQSDGAGGTDIGKVVGGDEGEWKRHLTWTQDKQGNDHLITCGGNLALILEHDEIWKDVFRENALTHSIEATHGDFVKLSPNHYGTELANWLNTVPPFEERMRLTSQQAYEQIAAVASRNIYDPLKDYLTGIEWDGIPRIENWLLTYLNAETRDLDGNDITDHLKRIGWKWLVGAVARGLMPGCQMDNALVIEGKEFVGKSSAFRILGGEFYHRAHLNLNDRDGLMTFAESWIAEFAEGAGLLYGAESSTQKNFLDRTFDKFRVPYARVPLRYPRRCVFAVTHNHEEGVGIFQSTTGNRRFWPVRAGKSVEVGKLERDRDQIWAEAVQVFTAQSDCPECAKLIEAYSKDRCPLHRWWLDRQETAIAEVQTEARTVDTGDLKSQVWQWWASQQPAKRPQQFTVVDVIKAMNFTKASEWTNAGLLRQVGKALGRLKFISRTRFVNGASTRMWIPTEELTNIPQQNASRKALDDVARA